MPTHGIAAVASSASGDRARRRAAGWRAPRPTSDAEPRRAEQRSARRRSASRAPQPISAAASIGSPSALFSGTKKPPATNHSPMTTRLKTANADDRDGRDRARSRATPRIASRERLAAPPARPRGGGQRADRDRPGFVAGQAREREHPADRRRPARAAPRRWPSPASAHHAISIATASRRQRQQQRLGHRRRLQVQHVRVQREDRRAGDRRRRRRR